METKLRQVRRAKDFSIGVLARMVDAWPNFLSALENGSTKAGQDMRSRIATALATSPEELFHETGWPRLV